MRVGETEIRTPDEDRIGFDLNWRWRMANALADLESAGARAPIATDPDVRKLVRHLMLRRKSNPNVAVKLDAFDRVIAWHGTQTGALVESFLIGAVTCEEAALELGIAVADIRLYSCLFFDLRDDEGLRRPAIIMRISADLQTMEAPDIAALLRKVALTSGIHGLRRFLNTGQQHRATEEPTLDELVEAELKRRLVAGELRTSDLTRLQANQIARQRLISETAAGKGPQLVESLKVVQYVLGLTAPTIVHPDRNQDRAEAADKEIQARFAAQKKIGATALTDDPGKGEAALNKMINANFTKTKAE